MEKAEELEAAEEMFRPGGTLKAMCLSAYKSFKFKDQAILL